MDNFGFVSILPTVFVIVLAWKSRQVILSIVFGIFLGATIINGYNPINGFLRTFDHYIIGSIADSWNASILLLNFAFGGMIALLAKSGGMLAIGEFIAEKAKTIKKTQLAVWILGIFIYFDEYFNALVIGNTMRPVTDKMKISREKLAYLTDTTASAVTSIIPISTWIAFEIGLVKNGLETINLDLNAFNVLVKSIPYRFYSIFALIIPLIIIFKGKEIGPMYKAEVRARMKGKVLSDSAIPMSSKELTELKKPEGNSMKWHEAIILILILIGITVFGLWYTGGGLQSESIVSAFGNADASKALVWAAIIGSFVTGLVIIFKKIMNVKDTMDTWVEGAKSILLANTIIVLAWSIGTITSDLGTAPYIISVVEGIISPALIPVIVFIVAAIVSFSTGTSWGTMSILMPICIPLAHSMATPLLPAIGSVLTGSIFGDHCSPISDTTILSSTASGSDHMDHVKTQIPYALLGAIVAAIVGFIPSGFGINGAILLIPGICIIYFYISYFGKSVNVENLQEDIETI